jgi:hypothetical protein
VFVGLTGVGLLVAGCSPVKMGAAAIVGDQRITIATLDTQVTNLSHAAKKYPGVVTLNQQQMTQATLTWLVRFQITEQVAAQQGITVTRAQSQQALAEIYAFAKSQAAASGVRNVTLEEVLAANGIPPDLSAELGRYQATYTQFSKNANGGAVPASGSSQENTVNTQFAHAECVAAKSLKIQVNPQFGQLNYAQLQVVAPVTTVSRSEGPTPTASPSGQAPAC